MADDELELTEENKATIWATLYRFNNYEAATLLLEKGILDYPEEGKRENLEILWIMQDITAGTSIKKRIHRISISARFEILIFTAQQGRLETLKLILSDFEKGALLPAQINQLFLEALREEQAETAAFLIQLATTRGVEIEGKGLAQDAALTMVNNWDSSHEAALALLTWQPTLPLFALEYNDELPEGVFESIPNTEDRLRAIALSGIKQFHRPKKERGAVKNDNILTRSNLLTLNAHLILRPRFFHIVLRVSIYLHTHREEEGSVEFERISRFMQKLITNPNKTLHQRSFEALFPEQTALQGATNFFKREFMGDTISVGSLRSMTGKKLLTYCREKNITPNNIASSAEASKLVA